MSKIILDTTNPKRITLDHPIPQMAADGDIIAVATPDIAKAMQRILDKLGKPGVIVAVEPTATCSGATVDATGRGV